TKTSPTCCPRFGEKRCTWKCGTHMGRPSRYRTLPNGRLASLMTPTGCDHGSIRCVPAPKSVKYFGERASFLNLSLTTRSGCSTTPICLLRRARTFGGRHEVVYPPWLYPVTIFGYLTRRS